MREGAGAYHNELGSSFDLGSGCARMDSRERVQTHSCKQATTSRRAAHPRGRVLWQDASDRVHPAEVLILETRLGLVSPK